MGGPRLDSLLSVRQLAELTGISVWTLRWRLAKLEKRRPGTVVRFGSERGKLHVSLRVLRTIAPGAFGVAMADPAELGTIREQLRDHTRKLNALRAAVRDLRRAAASRWRDGP